MPGDIAISGVRILLIDDDPEFCSLLNDYLELNSISLTCAHDGQSGLDILDRRAFDLILLDMFLPDINGLDVLRRIRRKQSPPVVMLSAHNEETDRIIALEIGADDYVPKAFSSRELLARIRAMTRTQSAQTDSRMSFGNITLDQTTYELSSPSGSFRLANKEYQMMELLLRNPRQLIPSERFLEKIWGYDSDVELNVVWVYISYLRKKLTALQADIQIKATRNAGYSLEKKP